MYYYSLFSIVALIILHIINHDVLFPITSREDDVTRNYCSYLKFIFVYLLVDAAWGIFDGLELNGLLYADTVIYHMAVAVTIVLWCRYVVSYLKPPGHISKILNTVGIIFLVGEFICMIINFHNPIFFWFDEDGIYRTGIARDITLAYQVIMYIVMAVVSFIFHVISTESTRNRYMAICVFCLVMMTMIIIQYWFPYLPLYTIGVTIGLCTLHVFVHGDERKEIRVKLQQSNNVLKESTDVIANAGYGIWKIQLDPEGDNRMEADEMLQKILGIENMDLLPEDIYVYFHSRLISDVQSIEEDYESMMKGERRTRELMWEHPDKGTIYMHVGGTKYVTMDNEVIISGFCGDITETKKKERRSDLVIKSLARSYQFMTYIKMNSLSYITYNWQLDIPEQYMEGDIREALDFACKQRVSPLFREDITKFADITTIDERMKNTNALIAQFKDMREVWHEWSYIVADRNEDGTIKNMIWAIRKIEDEKRAELRQKMILEESIAANRAKTMFLQNMSHEIRTPLNALFGFAQLLGMPDGSWTDEEKSQYNTYIHNSYNLLDMLIGDIIDIADSDHGNYRINISEVNVNQVCTNAIMSVEFRTPGNVRMYFTSDLADDYMIKSDGRRIQQVLINYLTNACKHTTQGEIHLHCSTTENPGRLTFSVTDTGEGVPADKADIIFNRFTKLNQFSQGSGLGLNICQMVAQKLHGEVYLDKSYTDGARFVFVIDDK